MTTNLAFGTPTLTVRNNRGAVARMLRYNRQSAEDALDERIERTTCDALGRVASHIDARLFAAAGSARPNFVYGSSLSGHVLRTDSVDAGTQLALPDVDGRPVWAHDARDTTTTWTYDPLGRPLTLQETLSGQALATREVWFYGETQSDAQLNNMRGRCVCCYDTAGKRSWSGFRLTGQPLDETRQLLADAEGPPDWSGQEPAWASALDTSAYTTGWMHDATGAWWMQTDAKRNVQQRAFDVAGQVAKSSLTHYQQAQVQPVLSSIEYTAAGQVLTETAGNGTVSSHTYEPETQRLIGLTVTRPAQAGRATIVQDLSYTYDPVGNVVRVSDVAQATSYWRNQKIAPARIYGYDALYQLVSATGREMANRGTQGHTSPTPIIPLPSDDSVYANFSRTYTYDRGGNLTAIQHQGAVDYTQVIVVSNQSNHAMLQNATSSLTPDGIDSGGWFDAAGNQQRLVPDATQPLAWNGRNRLQRVTLVKRNGPDDDREAYQYGGDGMRVRKRMTSQAQGVTRTVEAIYLPGLTLRVTSSGDGKTMTVVENQQEINSEAGNIHLRCLHWDTGQPKSVTNDSVRYGISDRSGSITLELDADADLISREEYYPYGGTAVWTARSQIEADTKFVRYSGKERDATGLYDYGYRHYQPWIGRWCNVDPAGIKDGLNVYRMVRSNPITLVDKNGLFSGSGSERYAVFPFVEGDIAEFGISLVEVNAQKKMRGKKPVHPLFVHDRQRARFAAWIYQNSSNFFSDAEKGALRFLQHVSTASNARENFEGVSSENVIVHIIGHGLPGEKSLSSGGESTTVAEVADLLEMMGLPPGSRRQVDACWSGAGKRYLGNDPDWLTHFRERTLGDVTDPENSFAAALHAEFERRGLKGSTRGYSTPLVFGRKLTIGSDGELYMHMAGARPVRNAAGQTRAIDMETSAEPARIYPRRRDVRVQWGEEPNGSSGFLRTAFSTLKSFFD
jgi:insecticidal toxin complex protein TccC